MKTRTLLTLICLSLLTPSLFGQTNAPADSTNAMTTPPPIPEEARKHFVMGETMFKEAKSADNFSQAASEFFQAANLAPQWPEARYNLALAKEAAGDYSGAMDDLKLYQQFKLSDDEARTVQDKIYALEAKQQLKASDDAAKVAAANAQAAALAAANSPEAQQEKFIKSLDGGVWRCIHTSVFQSNTGANWVDQSIGHTYIAINGTKVSYITYSKLYTGSDGLVRPVQNIDYTPGSAPEWVATLTSHNFNGPIPTGLYGTASNTSLSSDVFTISDDGQTIVEKSIGVYSWGNYSANCTYTRIN